ncbi:uncharacterized protein LOC114319193 [Camellia sinensis]|uniref:uncharacterized protein LOC114319193 n=1 Tax=Camellia sinensis TaxID=4442 RepID=UPI001035FDEA|nr:uncharacterized protein LOC114319193 [Camellia sinensis]
MDATTQTNTPSVPKLMADSFAAAQTQAQRGATTRTPAETEVTAKKREEPSTAPALSTDLSEWDIPLSQMVGETTSNPSGQLYQRKRRRLLLAAADDDDASTSPQHIHQIPSPISNVPTEPTVQLTPPPPEAFATNFLTTRFTVFATAIYIICITTSFHFSSTHCPFYL